jgi:hypothetical protein
LTPPHNIWIHEAARRPGGGRDALPNRSRSPKDKARADAEELAGYESGFAKIAADPAVIKWMLGVMIASVASLVIKTFV